MSDIKIDIRGNGVVVLTIDRPGVRNAIGIGTIAELDSALDQALEADLKVLVVRGSGTRAFVSGGDLKELAGIRDGRSAREMATRMRGVLDRLACSPVPVIAAINGAALGGGAELAVAADIRVAAADAQIGFTHVRLAILPAWGGAERLTDLVGRSKALLLIATGQILSAPEALEIGLVDCVAERDQFDSTWQRLADSIANLTSEGSRAVKAVVAAVRPNTHPSLADDAITAFTNLWISDAHWNAVRQLKR